MIYSFLGFCGLSGLHWADLHIVLAGVTCCSVFSWVWTIQMALLHMSHDWVWLGLAFPQGSLTLYTLIQGSKSRRWSCQSSYRLGPELEQQSFQLHGVGQNKSTKLGERKQILPLDRRSSGVHDQGWQGSLWRPSLETVYHNSVLAELSEPKRQPL